MRQSNSQDKHNTIINTTLDGYWELDQSGQFIDVNDKYCEMSGYTRKEMLGMRIPDIEAVESPEETKAQIEKVIKDGYGRFERKHRRKNGSIFDVEISTIFMKESNQFVVFVHDITESKKAEEALRESEDKYRVLTENTKDIVVSFNTDGIIQYISPQIANYGYKPEEIESKSFLNFIFPEDVENVLRDFRKTYATGEEFPTQFRIIDNKGSIHWIEEYGKIQRDESGNIIGTTGILRDITESKLANETISVLAANYSVLSSNDFFFNISEHLATTLDMDYAFIGELNASKDGVFVIAGYGKGQRLVPFEYALSNTPCENVMGKSICAYNKGVQDIFPRDTLLTDMGISSYIGAPIFKRSREPLGIMVLLDSKPLLNKEMAITLFNALNERVSTEIERKNAEEELQSATDIFNNIQVGLYVYHLENIDDFEGKTLRMIDANPASHKLTGVPVDNVKGKTLDENFPYLRESWEDTQGRNIPTIYAEVVRTGISEEIEQVVYGDSRVIEGAFSITAFPLPNNCVGVSFENITKRKQAENSLRESEERYRLVNESSFDFIYSYDINGVYTSGNKSYCDALGVPQDELIGKTHRDLGFPAEKVKEWDDMLQKVKKTNKSLFTESIVQMPDGHIHFYDLTLNPIHDTSGNIMGISGIARDITDSKTAEEALRASEENYRLVNDSSIDYICSYDLHGRYTSANQSLCKSLGQKHEDIIGKSLTELKFPNKYIELLNNLINRVKETNGTVISETTALRPDGIIHYYELIHNPIHDSNDTIIGISSITRDITERKQLEDERSKASKLESIGLLAGGIAHDFNNILAAILGNTSLAKLNIDSNSEEYEMLTETENATIRATQLTQQLLTFAKGGAPVKEIAELTALLKETTEFSLRGTNVNCQFSIDTDLWNVEVDKGQISQVIGNIVINAQQAMSESGTININAINVAVTSKDNLPLKDGNYIRISIADKGQGIPAEKLTKIFDPYFTTKQKGSGLGLATSFSIIHRHNGHISVKSSIGEGTTFTTYLPVSSKQIRGIDTVKEDVEVLTGKILVMDDDKSITKVVGMMLKSLGNDVAVSTDGTETIELYKKAMKAGKPFDVVIMDLTIPGGMGGKETIQELLKIDPNAKAIVSSGYSNDPVVSNYKEHGFGGYISKPYKLEELKKVMNEVMSGE
ncbi:PAS domain S-box protein [Candidatus Latescibacterota bacterium]